MSYSITGIQSIPASFPFPNTEHSSGGVIRPQSTSDSVDKSDTVSLSASETANASTPDRLKTLSSSSTDVPHAVSVLPVKVPGVVEPLDTVTLTTLDKVRSLRQQGQGDTQIAAALNLPLKEVQSDLHLETSQHLSFTVAPVVAAFNSNTAAVSAVA